MSLNDDNESLADALMDTAIPEWEGLEQVMFDELDSQPSYGVYGHVHPVESGISFPMSGASFPVDNFDYPSLTPDIFRELSEAVPGPMHQMDENAVFTPGSNALPPQPGPDWMAQCTSFIGQLGDDLRMPCCSSLLSEAQLDQILADPTLQNVCPVCFQATVAGRPFFAHATALKCIQMLRRAVALQPTAPPGKPPTVATGIDQRGIPTSPLHAMGLQQPSTSSLVPPAHSTKPRALPQLGAHARVQQYQYSTMMATPSSMNTSQGLPQMNVHQPDFQPPPAHLRPGAASADLAGHVQPDPLPHSPGFCFSNQSPANNNPVKVKAEEAQLDPVQEVPDSILQGDTPAVPADELLPLLHNGTWRSPKSCIPGLQQLQVHFSSQQPPHRNGVVELIPGGKQRVQVVGGRAVSVHLQFSHVFGRCALPFEKSNSKADPDLNTRRKFQKASVGFTVNVCVSAVPGEDDRIPPPGEERMRIILQAYTLQESDWQKTTDQAKDLQDTIKAHLHACKRDSQNWFQAMPDPNRDGAYQMVLNSMCDDVSTNPDSSGPWIGSKAAHFKHTFKGRTCKDVEINMTPGSMRQVEFKGLDLQPNSLAPVRLFVAALVSSGIEGGIDNVIAVELTVPMLCVGKRIKLEKNRLGEEVRRTDYFKQAMPTLKYEWTDAIQRLYEEDL